MHSNIIWITRFFLECDPTASGVKYFRDWDQLTEMGLNGWQRF